MTIRQEKINNITTQTSVQAVIEAGQHSNSSQVNQADKLRALAGLAICRQQTPLLEAFQSDGELPAVTLAPKCACAETPLLEGVSRPL